MVVPRRAGAGWRPGFSPPRTELRLREARSRFPGALSDAGFAQGRVLRIPDSGLRSPCSILASGMDLAAYDALISRLELSVERSPSWYRWRVALLALFGYGVIGILLLAGLALALGSLGGVILMLMSGHLNVLVVKLAAILGFAGTMLAWSIMRGVWIRIPRMQGVVLDARTAPELAREVESLRQRIGAPRVHRLVITGDFNAALAQRPRLGLFGWYENQLVLGLPLLRQLSVDQARSVIAHELGHLHGEHGRFGAWIYRLRVTWAIIAARGAGGPVVRAFLAWYAPLFNAYSFVLARRQEREADRMAGLIAGANPSATALARLAVIGRHHAGFWSELGRKALRDPVAPADIFDQAEHHLGSMPAQARRWLDEALKRPNDRHDEHPCLRERLASFGVTRATDLPSVLAAPVGADCAAHAWLGQEEARVATQLNGTWARANAMAWAQRHQLGGKLQQRRTLLAERAASAAISPEERWELVNIVGELDGPTAARSELEEVIKAKPDHAPALFRLGSILLEDGDRRGVDLIKGAMSHDRNAIAPGEELLRNYPGLA